LNAAQESQFKKLKSGCPTLSKCEYVEAAITSKSNDVYDRFVRRITRGLIFGASFNKSACNRRAYLERRKSVMEQRETDTLAIFKRLRKHVMDGTSWKLLIQEGDTVPRDELQHDDMTVKQSERLSKQTYVMLLIFERLVVAYKKELDDVNSRLLLEDCPVTRIKTFKVKEDVIDSVVRHLCNQVDLQFDATKPDTVY
jgi:hypothetical protein